MALELITSHCKFNSLIKELGDVIDDNNASVFDDLTTTLTSHYSEVAQRKLPWVN